MAAASIRDVAQHAGVSVGTVSNVLNRPGEVSADSITRVHAAIEELGYVRNDAARKLRAGVSTTVGFVVLDGQNPFFGDVVRGAEDEASQPRHRRALRQHRRGRGTRADVPRPVRGAAGARRAHLAVRRHQPRLERLRARGIHAVLVDRFSGDGRFSSVSVDSVVGGRMAVEHLIETGRRRIAFVGGPFEIRQVTDRLAGARVAVENSTCARRHRGDRHRRAHRRRGRRGGCAHPERPRHEWPDALFAANDLLALGLLQGLIVDGRMLVPDDIAIIGFDDIAFAAAAAVPLSSMRQPSGMIGRTALRVLLEETSDPDLIPRQTVFLPELIVRASTAPPRRRH